jgi:hypothetical protein
MVLAPGLGYTRVEVPHSQHAAGLVLGVDAAILPQPCSQFRPQGAAPLGEGIDCPAIVPRQQGRQDARPRVDSRAMSPWSSTRTRSPSFARFRAESRPLMPAPMTRASRWVGGMGLRG